MCDDDDLRVDTGDDDRISKEEFASDGLKSAMEKVIYHVQVVILFNELIALRSAVTLSDSELCKYMLFL